VHCKWGSKRLDHKNRTATDQSMNTVAHHSITHSSNLAVVWIPGIVVIRLGTDGAELEILGIIDTHGAGIVVLLFLVDIVRLATL
jgi:ABC-type nitrate/sulfonate/bicarbonate transport system substrate-binding protein